MIILAGAIILSLSNSGIIGKANEAVDATNLKQVEQAATLLWADAYSNGARTQTDLETAVMEGLEDIEGIDLTKYTVTVTEKESDKDDTATVPEEWAENVTAIVDTVPIPKGFVASQATGENTKDGGLVIYEGTEAVTDANVDDARENRNQFVWVPVDSETFSTADTQFKRTDYINSTSKVVDENGAYNNLGTSSVYWELELDEDNMPKGKTLLSDYIENSDLDYISEATIAEAQAMYASVKEYGGFYIARYEAGIDSQRTSSTATLITGSDVHSKMNKIPYNYIKWSTSTTMNVDTGAAVEVARGIYPDDSTNTTGVVSTLTYGVQWDRVVQWYIDTGAMTLDEVTKTTGSTAYGNYYDHDIASYTELNTGAKYSEDYGSSYDEVTETYTKESTKHILTTGALKAANVNNIYDMAGNVWEWTMEGYSTFSRILRGGSCNDNGDGYPVSYRVSVSPSDANDYNGFRPSLYIKK